MIPIVTPEAMAAIDAAALEPVDVLIERAGAAVAWAARRMLGGTYGRVVHVIAGPGNNGNDGRVAARRLRQWGVQVHVHDVGSVGPSLPPGDLVIDAAYGTGFHGTWTPPAIDSHRQLRPFLARKSHENRAGPTPVLAVDIPSGVDGLTGAAGPDVLAATRTVTFAALKPGLVLTPGRWLAGTVDVVDIGLDAGATRAQAVTAADVAGWWSPRPPSTHKWSRAVRVIAGSPGMTGAADLCSAAAQRAGAGMVTLSVPGAPAGGPIEVVARPIPGTDWSAAVLDDIERYHAAVVGPGLGRTEATVEAVRRFVVECPLPIVIDGDALFAVVWNEAGGAGWLKRRSAPTILTPHDGEFALLTGARPDADRLLAVRRLAADTRSVVLLKGPTTVIAAPDGDVRVVTTGDARLATAGTGDVLAGITGAFAATGMDALDAAAAAAWVHGSAAQRGPRAGLVAGDLADHIPAVLESLE